MVTTLTVKSFNMELDIKINGQTIVPTEGICFNPIEQSLRYTKEVHWERMVGEIRDKRQLSRVLWEQAVKVCAVRQVIDNETNYFKYQRDEWKDCNTDSIIQTKSI